MKNENILYIDENDIVNTYSKKWRELYFQHKKVKKLREETGWSKYRISDFLKIDLGRVKLIVNTKKTELMNFHPCFSIKCQVLVNGMKNMKNASN